MILGTIVLFIFILGLLVFVHELGHFVMAKRAGMKVEEFGFGFPPRLFGVKRGETTYSINWIPLGGFVKILGEDGTDNPDPRNFGNKTFFQRFAVLIAGVTMNVLLAWLLIAIGLGIGLPTVISEGEQLSPSARVKNVNVAIVDIAPESPVAAAGLRSGDNILKVNNEPIDSIQEVQDLTRQNLDKPIVYVIKRGGEEFEKTLTPRSAPPEGQGPLGIALSSVGQVSYPWYETLPRGFMATMALLWTIISAFGTIISQWVSGGDVGGTLSGPVGIAVLTRDVAELGVIYLLQFTAVLSVNLAVINAVPFPALDGGRILFLIIEKIRGKKMPIIAEQWANTAGFLLLLMLMVFVTVKDFGRFSIIDRVKDLF